jgi:hypothetical protein
MTDQYRATPEQWAAQKAWAVDDDDSSCILELRARVEALEAQYETQRQATLAWGKDVDNHGRWIDDHLKRIMALEARPLMPMLTITAAPADSLVERVAKAINPSPDRDDLWYDEARAAIREVAAALIDWHDSDQVVRTAWEAGKWLEQQANQ